MEAQSWFCWNFIQILWMYSFFVHWMKIRKTQFRNHSALFSHCTGVVEMISWWVQDVFQMWSACDPDGPGDVHMETATGTWSGTDSFYIESRGGMHAVYIWTSWLLNAVQFGFRWRLNGFSVGIQIVYLWDPEEYCLGSAWDPVGNLMLSWCALDGVSIASKCCTYAIQCMFAWGLDGFL